MMIVRGENLPVTAKSTLPQEDTLLTGVLKVYVTTGGGAAGPASVADEL